MVAEVFDGRTPDFTVGHGDAQIIDSDQFSGEERQLNNRASDTARNLHIVTGFERPEDEEHHASRNIGERTLQCKADGKAGCTQKRDKTCGFHAKFC